MGRITLILAAILAMSLVNLAMGMLPSPFEMEQHWANYKAKYRKSYDNPIIEFIAKVNYGVNKDVIRKHNDLYNSGQKTYTLAENQFSDMRFLKFKSLFPKIKPSRKSNAKPAPTVLPAAPSYDPRYMGIKLNIENQGTKCNSGWAYAAAKSIELFKAQAARSSNSSSLSARSRKSFSLSAQNLIYCAGGSKACKNQIPQAAFDYLTQSKNRSDKFQRGKCKPPTGAKLTAYSEIRNDDDYLNDDSLKSYVSAGMPVVVEVNPKSFQFMHYAGGIFQQPPTKMGTHYMVVVGYGTDEATGMDYWLLQNSFGITWGERGLMKLYQDPNYSIANNAIFPSEL